MEAERPEWITCITTAPGSAGATRSLCGRHVGFSFQNLEHAQLNEEQGGRLTLCDECRAVALRCSEGLD